MKATETSLADLLSGKKQYLMPLYQRAYSWTPKQFEQLWTDLVELAEAFDGTARSSHFMGSMVLAPAPTLGPAGVAEWLVVDGQQRLTTLTVLLAAIRDHAAVDDPDAVERIDEQYLVNKWATGDARYKVNPTQLDRPSYRAIVDRHHGADRGEGVAAAYRYFRAQLERFDDPDDPHDVRRLEDSVASCLSIVVISAQQGDNVHRIFESLNNTGVRLTQADLLRNYFFMRMPSRGETAYHAYWLPMQDMLRPDELEQVVWLDLILRGNPQVRRDEIYREQQSRLEAITDEAALEEELRHLHHLAGLFRLIVEPAREHDAAIAVGLHRLSEWAAQTVQPPVLKLLDLRARGVASNEQVASALLVLESFLVRRMIVGRATNNLNRIFSTLPAEIDGTAPVDDQVRLSLSGSRKYWPTDAELREAVLSGPFYWRGRGIQRAFVLRRLEQSFGSKEPVDFSTLTIEHVLPQQPSDDWWDVLAAEGDDDADPRAVHGQLVHTLGNLTLTGYNSTLSNRPFAEKRTHLSHSALRMNQSIAAHDHWNAATIRARAKDLAQRCIDIWVGPIESVQEATDSTTLTGLRVLLALIPPGTWTTYGDIAAILGSHPVAVGALMATNGVPNPWRVLNSQGRIADGFRWEDPSDNTDPLDLLRDEGAKVSEDGTVHPSQRLSLADLADLLGVQVDDTVEFLEDDARRELFESELRDLRFSPFDG
ncbi:MAG: DUF262 domain-containing protein, partial [Acidimicrobiales bacterium]|nr:DUF262 domain-containing protein [Acidimicrobiales bacterium]